MCIDMEQLKYREITVELFKRLRSAPEFRHYPHSPCPAGLSEGYGTGRQRSHRLGQKSESCPSPCGWSRGVLGRETVLAKQCDWPVPVCTHKPESDMAHESFRLTSRTTISFISRAHRTTCAASRRSWSMRVRQLDVP